MNLTEIHASVKSLAENDQSIAQADINRWIDAAIQKINQKCQANIPLVGTNLMTYTPEFDIRYHESLVLFSVGRYRESDSDYSGASYFMNQFEDMLREMQRDMYIPYCFRKDYNVQTIVNDEGALTYDLTIADSAYYGVIDVYLASNGFWIYEKLLKPTDYTINQTKKTITFKPTVNLQIDDIISISYEANAAFENPPYGNWTW
jgi:hypothetical protein